tara:strand:- start:285 stop:1451 length:1167 start_codon:yes stop_codon:yes gene_type:complete
MAINYTYPVKGQPVTADEFLIIDSVDNSTKRVTISSTLALGSGGAGGVSSFAATNGAFISFVPTGSQTDGVTLTGDLSATGTKNATTFLRGDNVFSTAVTSVVTGGAPITVTGGTSNTVTVGLTTVPFTLGGTGLTVVGTKFQALTTNVGATAIEWGDVISNIVGTSPIVVTTPDTRISTISLGTVPVSNGGTGGITAQAAINTITAVSASTAGDVLTNSGTDPANAIWAAPTLNTLASGQVRVGNSSGAATARVLSGAFSMSDVGVSTLNAITTNLAIQGYSPVSVIGGTTHTISQETELGFTLVFTAGAAVEVTLEDSVETPVGTEFHLINASTNNAAAVTLVVSGGTNINGDTSDIIMTNEFGRITCKKYSTNNYIVFGDRPVLT